MSEQMMDMLKQLCIRDLPDLYAGVSEHDPAGSGWCRPDAHPLRSKNPAIMSELFRKFPIRAALEIGVCFGAGIDVLRHCGGGDFLVVGVDPMFKPRALAAQGIGIGEGREFGNPRTRIVKKESAHAIPDVRAIMREHQVDAFDLIIIDGDHRYEPAMSDLLLYGALLDQGGLIYWDDTKFNRVVRDLRFYKAYERQFEVFGFGLELDDAYNACWIGLRAGRDVVRPWRWRFRRHVARVSSLL